MSFFQQLENEEKNKKIKAENLEKRKEEALRNNTQKLECKKIIPIVESLLKDLTNTYGYIVEQKTGGIRPVATFNVYETRTEKSWLSKRIVKSRLFIEIYVGSCSINDKLEVFVTPILVQCHDDGVHTMGEYKMPPSGINEAEVKQWLEDLFAEYKGRIGIKSQR